MKREQMILVSVLSMFAFLIIVSCGENNDHDSMQNHEEMTNHTKSPMVRDFDVEVVSLDENKDGKVFQCPMDWEVLSDESGSCPLCNMNLKEYSVSDAQKNLEEHKPHSH